MSDVQTFVDGDVDIAQAVDEDTSRHIGEHPVDNGQGLPVERGHKVAWSGTLCRFQSETMVGLEARFVRHVLDLELERRLRDGCDRLVEESRPVTVPQVDFT